MLEIAKDKLVEYNAALLSICMVVLLGFIDDVMSLLAQGTQAAHRISANAGNSVFLGDDDG